MADSRFHAGDRVAVYKPGHSEHGMTATIAKVIPIGEYGGPRYRGPHAYYPAGGWHGTDGFSFGGPLPDAMVMADLNNSEVEPDDK